MEISDIEDDETIAIIVKEYLSFLLTILQPERVCGFYIWNIRKWKKALEHHIPSFEGLE